MSPSQRGSIQGVAGILIGIGLQKKYPNAALGVALCGIVDALKGGIEDYHVRSYLRQLMATTPDAAQSSSAPIAGPAPAGYVFEPKGLAFSNAAGFIPPRSSAAGAAYDMRTASTCAR